MAGAAITRLRLALVMVAGGAVALLMPALLASVDPPSAVVLVALAVSVAGVVILSSRVVATFAPRAPAPRPRATGDVASFLAERVTDPLHHPLRPRAPGLA